MKFTCFTTVLVAGFIYLKIFEEFILLNNIVARCAPAAATVQVLEVNLLLTPTCHESWCP
jgi:hypothetical protein